MLPNARLQMTGSKEGRRILVPFGEYVALRRERVLAHVTKNVMEKYRRVHDPLYEQKEEVKKRNMSQFVQPFVARYMESIRRVFEVEISKYSKLVYKFHCVKGEWYYISCVRVNSPHME